jgi:hypothetical protein
MHRDRPRARIRLRTTSAPLILTSCLLHSAPVQTPAGRWKESTIFIEMVETKIDEPNEDSLKVWDSHPELGLKFDWSGSVNARHEAEGFGELTWSKEVEDGEELVSKYTGQMKNGMREGRGTLTLQGGGTYRGDWSKNVKSGNGIYFYANGNSYEGQFLNDLMHGYGTYAEADGTTYAGTFVNDQRHGRGTITLTSGKTYESESVEGVETPDSMARRSEASAKASQRYQLQVTLDHDYMQKLEKENEAASALRYRSRMVKGEMLIEPDLVLLDRWRERGHIDVTDAGGTVPGGNFEFSVGPVPLILGFENKGGEAITVEGGKLQVEKSAPDLQPIVVFYGADPDSLFMFDKDIFMRLGMSNLGEGKATNCMLELNISPTGAPPVAGDYAFRKHLGDMDERMVVDLREECASLGVDVTKVLAAHSGDAKAISREAAREMLGPFARFDSKGKWIESNGRLNALLSYDWTDADGTVHHEQTKLEGVVVIDPRTGLEFGAPTPIQGDYQLLLALQKNDYSIPFPFRRRVPPGGNTRFHLHICAPKSSDHRFQVVLKCSDGSEQKSAPIQMHYFLPRGETQFIKSGKSGFPNP